MAKNVLGLRILPPLAIARFGSSPMPLEAFELKEPGPEDPMGYRRIEPQDTFKVDPKSGAITEQYRPKTIRFVDRNGGHFQIRPVAPFLEVFAQTSKQDLEPLTTGLLTKLGLGPKAVEWTVEVANLKVFRQTGDKNDKVTASVTFNDHDVHELRGGCDNFFSKKATISFGSVRYIRPTAEFSEIRLRFTPAKGLVYGAHPKRFHPVKDKQTGVTTLVDDDDDPVFKGQKDRIVYDPTKGTWRGYQIKDLMIPTLPNPNDIVEGYPPDAPRVGGYSWGYLDDVCDGSVSVAIKVKDGTVLRARAWISACMPVFAPDSLPLRTVADELEQALFGPEIKNEEVSVEEAARLVWRALETVRFMNTRVMNSNSIDGRDNVASTLGRQDTNDFGRLYAPIFASSLVDNLAVRALHERVIAALQSGCAPWFAQVLRRPEEIGDLSDKTRRKMPAMLRGADSRALTLTRRQISAVVKAALLGPFVNQTPPESAHE